MRQHRAREGGFALLTIVFVIAYVSVLMTVLVHDMATLTTKSARHAQGVRARALSDAGIEVAFLKVSGLKPAEGTTTHIELEPGVVDVSMTPVKDDASRLIITSRGRLKLAGGWMCSDVTLTVRTVTSDRGSSVQVLGRDERIHWERSVPQPVVLPEARPEK